MKYKVDSWNNFCRVFELPSSFSSDFCFNGGIPHTFIMVDWFNPISNIPVVGVSKEEWKKKVGPIETIEVTLEELNKKLCNFLLRKNYIKKGRKYLIIFDFGASLIFYAKGEK